jgi:hypothetical protein
MIDYPQSPLVRTTLLALATTLTLLLPRGASAQVKQYPLEATDGLRLHNVAAEPAVLQGKKGLRVTFSEETVRRFKDLTPEEQTEARARRGSGATESCCAVRLAPGLAVVPASQGDPVKVRIVRRPAARCLDEDQD